MKRNIAGILFYFVSDGRISILLAEKRGALIWDAPVGEIIDWDQDPWMSAGYQTSEALGGLPVSYERRFSVTFPFGIPATRRTIFVAELPTYLGHGDCWKIDHHEGTKDFRQFSWCHLHALPRTTRWLLFPVLWRLWFSHRNCLSPSRQAKPKEVLNRRR
jgi:hypothetical protein